MLKEIRCPEHASCNKCKSSSGKLLFKVFAPDGADKGIVIEIPCPQIRGRIIRVAV